jgi:Domain of unknown function (DUF4249)
MVSYLVMRKTLYILFIFILIPFMGCEDVSVVNPDVNYKEYIVVRAELVAGEDFTGVKLTRTQPLNQQYDSMSSAITSNVTAYLKVNGAQVIPLHHAGNGIYMAIGSFMIQPGYTYELFAEVDDTAIYSITRVPEKPIVVSTQVVSDSIFQANVQTETNAVYGAAWEIYNSSIDQVIASAPDFKEIIQNTDAFKTSAIPVNTMGLPVEYRASNYKNLWYLRVYAYDTPYLKYFRTKNNNQPVSDVFSQGGDQVIWNVVGNNAIGMFIGVAKGDYVHVQ